MQNLKRCRLPNQPKPLILLSIHIGSRLPLCSRKNGKCNRSCFSRSIFWTIFPTMTFIFFPNIILFVSVGHFSAGSSSVKIKATYWRIPIGLSTTPCKFSKAGRSNIVIPQTNSTRPVRLRVHGLKVHFLQVHTVSGCN